MKARILVVDDEAEIRRSVRMILEYEGYDVQEASSGPEALALIEREPPDLMFLDIKMARAGRPGDAAEDPPDQRGLAGRDDLRPRHGQHRRRGDQARGVRLHREAAGERARAADHPQRARPDPPGRREPLAQARRRGAAPDGRRERVAPPDLGRDQARRADQRDRAAARARAASARSWSRARFIATACAAATASSR